MLKIYKYVIDLAESQLCERLALAGQRESISTSQAKPILPISKKNSRVVGLQALHGVRFHKIVIVLLIFELTSPTDILVTNSSTFTSNVQPKWPVLSRPLVNPPEARPRGSSWPPRLPGSPPHPLVRRCFCPLLPLHIIDWSINLFERCISVACFLYSY